VRVVIALGLAACAGATRPPAPPAREPPRPSAEGLWDRGEFAYELKGEPAGTETFSIERTGDGFRVRSSTMLELSVDRHRLIETELDTDAAWRPIRGVVRDARDGGTISTLDGDPLRLAIAVAGVPTREHAANGRVDLFINGNTLVHYAPLCAIDGAAVRTAFPGMTVAIASAVPAARATVARRDVDLGGATRVAVYCDGAKLVGVEVPIAGFVAVRAGYDRADLRDPGAVVARAVPALPEGLSELDREVVVRASKHGRRVVLACSLVVPSTHAARTRRERATALPAVVFVTGSGPQDRDENAVGGGGVTISAFRVLAYALGTAGVASLRCDDRGTGDSTGTFGDATLDTLVGDARAQVAALRREPAIDPARIGVIGHSEGGVIAPILAAKDKKLRALALLAAPGRPLDEVLLEQVDRAQRRTGAADADRVATLARYRAVFDAIRDRTPMPDTTEARDWKGGEAWLRSHLRHDPATTAARVRTPAVLIAQGGTDQQVGVADAEALDAAFRGGGNRRVTYKLYPDLNHLFVASSTGNVSEYADPDAALDAAFVADVVGFLSAL
jgi:dienelactone hydrolase